MLYYVSVVVLNAANYPIMLNVVMLSVVMLSVVAPFVTTRHSTSSNILCLNVCHHGADYG
jgi:hypothetical protein